MLCDVHYEFSAELMMI